MPDTNRHLFFSFFNSPICVFHSMFSALGLVAWVMNREWREIRAHHRKLCLYMADPWLAGG